MLYAILAYHVEAEVMSWTPEQDAAVMTDMIRIHDGLNEKKLLGPAARLGATGNARTLRGPGAGMLIDGPFAETKEQLLGFHIVDCADEDAALAVARQKPNQPFPLAANEFALVLDDLRDPGNLGTIIRTADWYGIAKIIASEETADVYGPKVISATMGSFTRVSIFYTDLATYLKDTPHRVFGTYLDGTDVHTVDFGVGGLIVIGNESKGIAPPLEAFITDKITIPRYGLAESLNAGIATAVVCDNVRRSRASR